MLVNCQTYISDRRGVDRVSRRKGKSGDRACLLLDCLLGGASLRMAYRDIVVFDSADRRSCYAVEAGTKTGCDLDVHQ